LGESIAKHGDGSDHKEWIGPILDRCHNVESSAVSGTHGHFATWDRIIRESIDHHEVIRCEEERQTIFSGIHPDSRVFDDEHFSGIRLEELCSNGALKHSVQFGIDRTEL
jgi:hypothetical protein